MTSNPKSPGFFSRLVRGSGPKSPDEAQVAHTRRREQVRRAQRTHRERKEKYVRSLEVEVARLREQDAAHAQEIGGYRQKIRHLQDLLTSNGIVIPVHLLLALTPSPQASISVVDQPDGTQGIHATMPVMQSYEQQQYSPDTMVTSYEQQIQSPGTFYPTQSPGASYPTQSPGTLYQTTTTSASERESSATSQINTTNLNQSSPASSHVPNIPHPGPTKPPNDFHPSGLDAAQIAVDFVLALESPCLHHHPADPNATSIDSSGHALMLQSPIMTRCPTPLSQPSHKPRQNTLTWNVPAIEIEKLLGLSAGLSLEGEITPIEAWQRIRRHPGFGQMDYDRLEILKGVLAAEVKCYGFGAVIDEDYFDMIVRQAFAQAGS